MTTPAGGESSRRGERGPSDVRTRAELGAALERLRARSGLSLRELSRQVSDRADNPIGPSALGEWCRGQRLPLPSRTGAYACLLAVLGIDDIAPWLDALARVRIERELAHHDTFDDLVGLVARQQLLPEVTASEQAAALRQLTAFYLVVADQADRAITPHRYRVPLRVDHQPSDVPDLHDHGEALAWLAHEEENLVATCLAAGAAQLDEACWQLAYVLRGYFFLAKRWVPWVVTHQAALESARRLGDQWAEATTLDNMGRAAVEQGQLDLAAAYYRTARQLFRAVGDEHGEHTAQANHAWVAFQRQRYARFLREIGPAHRFYLREGSARNAAITLRGMALAETRLGRCDEAIGHLHDALGAFVGLGLRLDTAMTLNGLGEAYARAGLVDDAGTHCTQALEAAGLCGSVFEQARARHQLGALAAAADDLPTARTYFQQALEGYRTVGATQAADVKALLTDLRGDSEAPPL